MPTGNGELLIYGLTAPASQPRRPDDLMAIWNYGGSASFAMYRSTTTSFDPQIFHSTGTGFVRGTTSRPDGGWGDSVKWLAGDFDGDGKSDIAAVWNNGGRNAIAMRGSYGTGFHAGVSWMRAGLDYGGWMNSTSWVAGKYLR